MTIKMTMKELLEMRMTLLKISSQDLPIKVALKYSILFKEFEKFFESFNEMRNKLFQKYNIQSDSFNFDSKETEKEFEKDYNDLLNYEIILEEMCSFNLEELGEEVKLSITDVMYLKPIL